VGVRFNCFATAVPDNFAFASSLSVRTSSFDHANNRRRFAFAINAPPFIKGLIIPALQ
jgi:hypothetical protein